MNDLPADVLALVIGGDADLECSAAFEPRQCALLGRAADAAHAIGLRGAGKLRRVLKSLPGDGLSPESDAHKILGNMLSDMAAAIPEIDAAARSLHQD
jgi:hypothetical protein